MLTTEAPFSVCRTAADYSREIEQSFEDICSALDAMLGDGDSGGATTTEAAQRAAPSTAALQGASDRFNRLCDEFHQLLVATSDKLLLTAGAGGGDENGDGLSDAAVQAHLDRTAAMQQKLRDTAAQVLQLHA